jgi:hypothetical protein
MLLDADNILIFTSLIFITNTLAAFYKKYYLYAFLFLCLTLTSLLYHSTHTFHANIIDKIATYLVVFYGGYMLYTKCDKSILFNILIIISFLACVFLYMYGCYINDFCFHPEPIIANSYHALMHFFVVFGHNLIIFL